MIDTYDCMGTPAQMAHLMSSMNVNKNLQLDKLVLYGLNFSEIEATRSLAHLLAR